MSLNRYAAKVDRTQKAIVDGLRAYGYRVEPIGRPVDLLIWWASDDDKNLWKLLEVKTPQKNGKPRKRKEQKAQQEFCEATGVPRVTNLSEALAALK